LSPHPKGADSRPFSAKPLFAPILCQTEINPDFGMFDISTILFVSGSEEPIFAVQLLQATKMGKNRCSNAFSNQSIIYKGFLKRGGIRKRVASLPLLLSKKQKKDPC
jgi:hypothetical protein